jgi:hypothetical protein
LVRWLLWLPVLADYSQRLVMLNILAVDDCYRRVLLLLSSSRFTSRMRSWPLEGVRRC